MEGVAFFYCAFPVNMQIHQFHPTVSFGDGISNQILSLQRLLRKMGYKSEIFCRQRPLHYEGKVREIANYKRYTSPDNLLILHYSLAYSSDVWDWLNQIPDRKVVCYHNITPHYFFSGINETFYDAAIQGRQQFSKLLQITEAGWGDSSFNVEELVRNGWENVGVLPIIFDPQRYAVSPNKAILERYQGQSNILYVSRISPNKKPEDVILTYYYLKRIRPDARLILVGSANGMGLYLEYLQTLVSRLDLQDVIFTGHVSAAEWTAYYQASQILLSMSEHEGFGIPLLEAMKFGLPAVAYKTGAVPETLGNSGVLVAKKDYPAIAELLGILLDDEVLREKIIVRQRMRLKEFLPEQVEKKMRKLLDDLGITG